MQWLPAELVQEICIHTDYADVISMSETCRRNLDAVDDRHFWIAKLARDYPPLDRFVEPDDDPRETYEKILPFAADGSLEDLIIDLEDHHEGPAIFAIDLGDWPFVKYVLSTGQHFSEDDMDWAATTCTVGFLEFLSQTEPPPTSCGANGAAGELHMDVLEWLETHGILPTVDAANRAAREAQLPLLDWLAARGILPTADAANRVAKDGDMPMLEWLARHGICPSEK